MHLGIIREGKIPPDSRVPLTPAQCASLVEQGIEVTVQPSSGRCFDDQSYYDAGIRLSEDLSTCDVLLGVKEVPIENLLSDKTYFFFSHTIKEQPYNRKLLQAIVNRGIRLIDYEVLTNDQGARLIAFGKFAGMVGAHNGLWTYGQKTGAFSLPRLKDLVSYSQAQQLYKKMKWPPLRVVLTGTGRVAGGAAMVLKDMGFRKVSPVDYVKHRFNEPVYTQLNSFYYAKRKDGETFDDVKDFYTNPEDYESDFHHFLGNTDIFINGIYWDNRAPAFFTLDQMKSVDFVIQVIADVTCDIAPVSSIPSTLRATTIEDPVFGFEPQRGIEVPPFQSGTVDMMTIDNLPNELPRDASEAFGNMFIEHILPEFDKAVSKVLGRATVAIQGDLGPHFEYLRGYLNGD